MALRTLKKSLKGWCLTVKFYSLFRKELKEMLSLQTIITMIVTVVVLVMAGQAMSGAISDSAEKASDLTICDLDKIGRAHV